MSKFSVFYYFFVGNSRFARFPCILSDYLQSSQSAGSDNMLNALMMRHRALSATNEQCVDNLADMVDEVCDD